MWQEKDSSFREKNITEGQYREIVCQKPMHYPCCRSHVSKLDAKQFHKNANVAKNAETKKRRKNTIWRKRNLFPGVFIFIAALQKEKNLPK